MFFSNTICPNITKHCSERITAAGCEYRSVSEFSLWRISTFWLSKRQMVYPTSKQKKPSCSYSVAQNNESVGDHYLHCHCAHIRLRLQSTAHCIPGPTCAGINLVWVLLERYVQQWICARVFCLNIHSICSYLRPFLWLDLFFSNTQFTWFRDYIITINTRFFKSSTLPKTIRTVSHCLRLIPPVQFLFVLYLSNVSNT